jgi:hypothetical protein
MDPFAFTLFVIMKVSLFNGSTDFCWALADFFNFVILYTVGRTPWTGGSACRKRPLPTHRIQNKRTQIFITRVGFEPRAQTARPL